MRRVRRRLFYPIATFVVSGLVAWLASSAMSTAAVSDAPIKAAAANAIRSMQQIGAVEALNKDPLFGNAVSVAPGTYTTYGSMDLAELTPGQANAAAAASEARIHEFFVGAALDHELGINARQLASYQPLVNAPTTPLTSTSTRLFVISGGASNFVYNGVQIASDGSEASVSLTADVWLYLAEVEPGGTNVYNPHSATAFEVHLVTDGSGSWKVDEFSFQPVGSGG